MLFRLVAIRCHKNIIFCDSFNENFEKIQLAIPSELFNSLGLKVGSVISTNYQITKNKYGNDLYFINDVQNVSNHNKNISFKSINTKLSSMNQSSFISALNGGVNLKYWEMKQKLLEEIRKFLVNRSYIEVNTSLLMDNRGTSTVNPMQVNGKYCGNKYLKITHELELKKICYLTLKSLFEIGYVTRDVYSTSKSANQYLTFELVAPIEDTLTAEELYIYVYEIAIKLAESYGISYNEIFNKIETVDVLKLYLSNHKKIDKKEFLEFYKKLLELEKNIIYVNAPTNTPLAKESEYGIPLETKWAIGNRGIGHGYYDQNQLSVIENLFELQKDALKEKGIDSSVDKEYLMTLMYAGIDTKSLNIGIDRFMYKFLGLDHEEKAIKILGL
ncbi:MAG: hypothetical protein IJE04_01995 [Bacilli bacterium]|nr:hypothetical protein [Bacilli bacterium]